ncbi:hypothetical protein HNP55_004214 [Paucibacter oligotrophus]|uniref:Uncharacterized protein n=1 Tax=Roseateles oligotrophus TaxID=1769250 RepID=A0A840LGB0_9BURK|nr:nucleotidyltransferase family protein [Roseateles oligotrophus]MBB4845662.1 hypothetical protein [Roseateles oligotrophus]
MPPYAEPPSIEPEQAARLIALLRQSPWLMEALRAVRGLGLASWCIGAGALRNLVWDALHGRSTAAPCAQGLSDVDVAFFDASDLSPQREAALRARLGPVSATAMGREGSPRWARRSAPPALACGQAVQPSIAHRGEPSRRVVPSQGRMRRCKSSPGDQPGCGLRLACTPGWAQRDPLP